jgi:hypothetical protein
VAAPVRDAGGDNEVPRDSKGRPRIIVPCAKCSGTGKAVSEKTGNPVKCKGSCGPSKAEPDLPEGHVLRSFTRTTTYIDVLDDKSNLEAWQMRMVLVGVADKTDLLNDVPSLFQEQQQSEQRLRHLLRDHGWTGATEERAEAKADGKKAKDALNRKAQVAKEAAGAEDKADKGTELHSLSELVDTDQELPHGISFEVVLDLDAYRRVSEGFKIVHMEKLVVSDALKVAGTPDRVSEWFGDEPLIAPDGHEFRPGELMITDLKTGTTEYGALKMAMQLAIYANSLLYDHTTGERTEMDNLSRKWGIIMNVPAGTGRGMLLWADLELGWEAVQVAGMVRRLRSVGGKALTPFHVV